MRLSKFLLIVTGVALSCLFYVWQQTEIFRLAYLGQKNLTLFQDSLDKNSVLRYDLKRKTSLIHLGSKLSESDDFQVPGTYCLVKLASSKENIRVASKEAPKRQSLAYRLFGVKQQAEAQTINTVLTYPSRE